MGVGRPTASREKNSSCEPPLVSVAASISTRLSFLPCPPSKSTSPSAFRLKVRAQMSFDKFSRLRGREKTEEPLLPTHFVMPQCNGEFASNAKKMTKRERKKDTPPRKNSRTWAELAVQSSREQASSEDAAANLERAIGNAATGGVRALFFKFRKKWLFLVSV